MVGPEQPGPVSLCCDHILDDRKRFVMSQGNIQILEEVETQSTDIAESGSVDDNIESAVEADDDVVPVAKDKR